ncbi:MAG: beta-lactamase family protein [Bacteroidales bacterium]|nr:beta-lactamase family protein [Candidatus Cacconaster merdequi]
MNNISKRVIVIFTIAAIFIFAISAATQPWWKARRLDKELSSVFNEYRCTGLSVVAVNDGKIVYQKDFGVKDVAAGTPVDGATMYRIASISKSITATAVMQLVDSGLISLDTDASDIAGFPIRNPHWPDNPITIEMLLSHTSSISDEVGYNSIDFINPAACPDFASSFTEYQPGTNFNYCDLNFNILATFVEKLSGERFDEYVRWHILEPMGITGSFCVDSLDRGNLAKIYRYEEGVPVEQPEAYASRKDALDNYQFGHDAPVFSGSAGMKITAADLAVYMMMLMKYGWSDVAGARILSAESAEAIQASHTGEEGYGLGFGRTEPFLSDHPTFGHTGGAYGLRSAMCFDESRKLGVVILCSGSDTPEGKPYILQATVPPVFHYLGL